MNQSNTSWLSWLVFIGGLWMIISPFVLGHSAFSSPTTNEITVGVIVAVLALISAWASRTFSWLSWINALLGIWLIASPFILNYTSVGSAMANDIILGIAILVVAGARALSLGGTEAMTGYGPSYYSEERGKREKDREREMSDREPEV